jgi:transcriptional regulator with XRE-family HTH domain
VETFGQAVRRPRGAVSLRELARRAYVDPGHLSKIENDVRLPTLDFARAIDKALNANGELILLARIARAQQDVDVPSPSREGHGGAVAAGADSETADGPADWEDPTKRREFLQAAGVAAVDMVLADAITESGELSRLQEASELGPVTLHHLDLAVERFGLIYLHTSPVALFAQVRACRKRVAGLLEGRHTLSQRRHLYVAAGWLSGLLGHLSLASLGQSFAWPERSSQLRQV